MPADIRVGTLALDAMLNAVRNLMDAGPGPAKATVYGGNAPGSGPVLGTLNFSRPCAPDAQGGVLEFAAIFEAPVAEADGDARWVRITNGRGDFVLDGNVLADDATGDAFIRMPSTEIRRGGPIRIEALSLRF